MEQALAAIYEAHMEKIIRDLVEVTKDLLKYGPRPEVVAECRKAIATAEEALEDSAGYCDCTATDVFMCKCHEPGVEECACHKTNSRAVAEHKRIAEAIWGSDGEV